VRLGVEDNVVLTIRPAGPADLPTVTALDASDSGAAKPDYWADIYERYVADAGAGQYFLVAEIGAQVVGFIVGEVRAWEFGSPPTGWVFAINVAAERREDGIARDLLAAICDGFRDRGVATVRTMISRDDILILSFFRSQGLSAGPYIELEKEL
jgi:GNAT superfamily N-acetyltransferase